MFSFDDEDLQAYFSFYDEDDAVSITNQDCGYAPTIIKKEYNGTCCRSCNEFNKYAEPDSVTSDSKYTCWSCASHPERKRKGLTAKETKALEAYYKKHYKSWSK